MAFSTDSMIDILSSVLLFCLVFGMSATVDIRSLMCQLKNVKAIATGLFLQFFVLPVLGFLAVNIINMDQATGLTLLVVTSSPGGSYSNWWCSMFNADLALSVTMTAISTMLSTIMLPVNLLIYVRYAYDSDVVKTLDWPSLAVALAIVIAAIAAGLWASASFHSHSFNLQANRLGNFAGVTLVLFSAVMSNTDKEARIWDREWEFYVGVALPCVVGLLIANIITTAMNLHKPERVSVSIECCYQNVGIATSVALAMFDDEDQARAVAVPFYYGVVEAVLLLVYCITAWKADWTKAPSDVSVWTMLSTSYEVLSAETDETQKGENDDEEFCYVNHKDAPVTEMTGKSSEKSNGSDAYVQMP